MTTNATEIKSEAAPKAAPKKDAPKKAELIAPENQKNGDENLEYYKEWGKRRIDCTINVANSAADKVIQLTVPSPSNPKKSIPIEVLCGERIKEGLPIFAVEQIENAYTVEMKEIPKHRRTGDVGETHEMVKMPLYTVKRHGEVENPKPIGSIKAQ
jgi:hypothetical protein